MRFHSHQAALLLFFGLITAPVLGQTNRNTGGGGLSQGLGFNSSGGFGSTGTAGGIGGGGLGGGGLGGGLGGGGLGGQGGFGQGAAGGFGTQTGFGQSASGFVGRDSAEVTNMFENMTRQGNSQANRSRDGGGRNSRNDQTQETQQRVRVQLKVAFAYPDPLSTELIAQRNAQLNQVLALRNLDGVTFRRDGDRVMLTGTVASTWEQKVALQLASQQPGVASVSNQMSIAESISVPTRQE